MTNEQLAIVLESMGYRLATAVDAARGAIAATRPEHEERVHSDPRCIGLFCQNGEHFVMKPFSDTVDELAPIEDVARWLDDMIASLRPKT